MPGLSAVLALSRLRMLGTWAEERWEGMLQPDAHEMLARLQHLEGWEFESLGKEEYTGSVQVGGVGLLVLGLLKGCRCSGCAAQLGMAALHAWKLCVLRQHVLLLCSSFRCMHAWARYDAALSCCAVQVGDAVLLSCSAAGYNRASGAVQHLMLNGVRELSSLQQLMAGLLPARSPPVQLHSLVMYGSCLTLQAVQNCSFLEHLNSLGIHGRIVSTGSANVVVEALLGQAAKLRKLCLQAVWLDDLPPTPCLASEWRQLEPFVRRARLHRISLCTAAACSLPHPCCSTCHCTAC